MGEEITGAFQDAGGKFVRLQPGGVDAEMGGLAIPRLSLAEDGGNFFASVWAVE